MGRSERAHFFEIDLALVASLVAVTDAELVVADVYGCDRIVRSDLFERLHRSAGVAMRGSGEAVKGGEKESARGTESRRTLSTE